MLYIVSTPIGNMSDISLRALETLGNVDLVASEDTRKTGLLLKRYEIKKPQLAFHEHNEEQAGNRIMGLIEGGKSVALVTNAGTPGISDPGFTLIRRAIQAGVKVTAIPGPAAFVMAVILSGLPVHSFTFRGFPPHKPGPRRRFLQVDQQSPHTLVFYESPHRLKAFLADALEVYGDRDAAVAGELTKMFESVDRGQLSQLVHHFSTTAPRGEYTVVIAGASTTQAAGGRRQRAGEADE